MSLWKYSETEKRMRIPRKHAVSSCYFSALNHLAWAPSLRSNVKSGLFDYRYNMIACHSVTEGYKRTGNGWCTWGEKMIEHLTHVCFSVLMLCDRLSLISHFPTLERTIKPLSEELIERVIQIAHIWGSKRGEVTKTISFVQAFSSLSPWMTS